MFILVYQTFEQITTRLDVIVDQVRGRKLFNKKRHPTIADYVTIYSGASILGGDTVIGKGAVIGGNVFLTKSIAAGTKVSVKNQELRFNKDHKEIQEVEADPDAAWFYII